MAWGDNRSERELEVAAGWVQSEQGGYERQTMHPMEEQTTSGAIRVTVGHPAPPGGSDLRNVV